MPTVNIKQQHGKRRFLLARLATYAYQQSAPFIQQENPQVLLGLNIEQAQKYGCYQFIFDPKQEFGDYKTTIEKAFNLGENDPQANEIFNTLAAEHPHGVEIWVNNPFHQAKNIYHPLVENHALLVADSLLSATTMMLKAMQKEQKNKAGNAQGKIDQKFEKIQTAIDKQHQKTTAAIKALYEDKKLSFDWLKKSKFARFFSKRPKSPEEKHFEQAEEAIRILHRSVVAQLAMAEKTEGELPSQKDYKKMYIALEKQEQSLKWDNFIEGSEALDPVSLQFNRDIFSLDIQEEKDERQIIQARLHYHNRHYLLTAQQVALQRKQLALGAGESLNYDRPQVTATAHNSENLLSNYALVDEGNYRYDPEAGEQNQHQVSITLMTSRYGSPTPYQLYQTKNVDRDQATYYGFLCMEQQLQALRAQVIEEIILSDQTLSNLEAATIKTITHRLAYEITQTIHVRNLDNTGSPSNEQIVQKAITSLLSTEKKENIKQELLKLNALIEQPQHADRICHIKNLHTHLITPTGVLSKSEGQYQQALDARIAQYATQDTNGHGFIYMCNAIDIGRFDTMTFRLTDVLKGIKGKIKGTNRVALIALYENLTAQIPKDHQIKAQFNNGIISQEYTNALNSVRKQAKIYVESCKQQLNEQNPNKEPLHAKRGPFSNAEKKLHEKAERLQGDIYNKVKDINLDSIKNDPNYKSLYLALKAYQIALNLFNEKHWSGLRKWRLTKYNGLLQAMVQLAAEQSEMFASSGCKSANDRELLLALILAKLAEYIEDPQNYTTLTLATGENVIREAQEAYAWHISRRQTALDRSSLPKTGAELLQHAKQVLQEHESKLGSHEKFGKKLAAHKRVIKEKKERMEARELINTYSNDYRLYALWYQHYAHENKTKLQAIGKQLKALAPETGLSSAEKLEKYKELNNLCTQYNKDYPFSAMKYLLREIRLRQLELKVESGAIDQGELKNFLDLLNAKKATLTANGEGWRKIGDILEKYQEDQNKHAIDPQKLIETFQQIVRIASARTEDATSYFSTWGFFQSKRPPWLQQLYNNLAEADFGSQNFSFDTITQGIPGWQPANSPPPYQP